MIKFTKNLLFNPAEICISGIRCNFDNIAKISTIFDFKWTEVTIDSVKEGSSLLEFVVVPCPLFEVFLDKAIKENPENIFMLNLLEPAGNVCLQQPFEELVITGITDVFISIALDENALLICMNKSLVIPQEVFKRLKKLCFD